MGKRRRGKRKTLSAAECHAIRKRCGFTRQQMADEVGVSVHTVRSWEAVDHHHRPPNGSATILLRVLNIRAFEGDFA